MPDVPDYSVAGPPEPWQWPEATWRRAVLARAGCPATFFVPGVSALLHPEEVRALAGEGHEIALHSWIGENNAALPAPTERDLAQRAAETLTKLAGRAPEGMRAASRDFSPNTLAIARKLGLLYDSTLMADDDPYELLEDGRPSGVVEIPPEWSRDDAPCWTMRPNLPIRPNTPPAGGEEIFRAEFDVALAEGGLFEMTMHPHISGRRSRIGMLERLLAHAKATGAVWFATHEQVARWCLDHAPEAGS